jgi:hypothetical protein
VWTRYETDVHNAVIPVLAEGKRTEVMLPPLRRPMGSIAKLRGRFTSFAACLINEKQAHLGVNAIANDAVVANIDKGIPLRQTPL